VDSLHIDLRLRNQLFQDCEVLPLGFLKKRQLKQLLMKNSSIYFASKDEILKEKDIYACPLYDIFKNSSNAYGVPAMRKKTKCVSSFFNKYKFVSR
jgi:hypothetical protein